MDDVRDQIGCSLFIYFVVFAYLVISKLANKICLRYTVVVARVPQRLIFKNSICRTF